MRYMLVSWLVSALAFMACTYVVPGFKVDSFTAALVAAAVLGIVNAVIRPIVILFTLPLTILTLGLSLLVVNALMLGITVWLVPGVHVFNLMAAIIAALLISIINATAGALLG